MVGSVSRRTHWHIANHTARNVLHMNVNPNDLDEILTGEPIETMEAAKRIIQQYPIDLAIFISLATNKGMRLWTRTASIWLLGFVDDQGVSLSALGSGLNQPTK